MSLHKFAEQVAAQGRGDDSLLVHMTPDEVSRLQQFAEANGRSLTINPHTGLPEAGMLSDLFKAVAPIALGALLGPAGFGLSATMAGVATGGITALATGSLSRGLMAGLGAYGGAGLGESLMGAGTSAGLTEALAGSTADTGAQVFGDVAAAEGSTGQAFNEFLKSNANPATQSFGDMASAGAKAVANDPMAFVKDNFKYLGAAAAPIMADMMVPTTTKQPDIAGNDTINQFIYGPNGQYRRLNPVPAKNYGTPAFKPFAAGGIVALAAGGIPGMAAGGLDNIYANLGGKQVYDKIASDYLKAGGTEAGLPSIFSKYDTPVAAPAAAAAPAGLTADQKAAMNLMLKSSTGGVDTSAMDAMGGAAAVRKLAESAGYTGTPTQLYDFAAANPGSIDWTSDAGKQLAMNNYTAGYTNTLASKFKTPQEQALELFYRSTTQGAPTAAFDTLGGYAAAKKLAEAAGFEATPEWQQAYEKKMGYAVIPRMSTAESIAAEKAAQAKLDAAGLATLPRVDAGADTRLDFTGDGTSTVKPVAIKSDGTYTGTTTTAPPIGTTIGQGTYVGQGSDSTTGTTGGIMDFGGKSAFGNTSPLALAKQQIAEESAAKTSANNAKMDLYRQWVTQNPKATDLEHANFLDKVGLDAATAAQATPLSADQMQSRYYDAKFNKQTGDSMAAYNYLMGKGAYPTKSGVGEIARPYAEATLGYPASTNRQYIFDQATGKYIRNPDYVAEYKDPSGGVNYLLSPKEIFNYFKTNAGQDDAATYAWAVANNLTPKEISEATGVPISTIAPKWRAAAANKAATTVKNADGTINQEATDKAIADKAAAQEQTNFDATAYLKANPDVQAELDAGKANFGNKSDLAAAAWNHYLNYGKAEGRAYTKKAAGGGMMGYAMGGMPMYAVGGGLGSLGSYSDGGRLLKGPGDGVSDSIPATIGAKQQPARLADGEFVIPARIVSELGNGSTDAGAKKLYAMMDRVQRARGKTTGKNKVAANSRADKYLPA